MSINRRLDKDDVVHTAMCKTDNQQGPTGQHRELRSMLCGSRDGRGVWGRMDICIPMAEFLPSSLETISALLICYTPIQNKNSKKKKRCGTYIQWNIILAPFIDHSLDVMEGLV